MIGIKPAARQYREPAARDISLEVACSPLEAKLPCSAARQPDFFRVEQGTERFSRVTSCSVTGRDDLGCDTQELAMRSLGHEGQCH